MILTAQRVISPSGMEGVNVYHYRHDPRPWPFPPTEAFDLPRMIAWRNLEVPVGGNRIRSYLDIAVPPDVRVDEIERCVGFLVNRLFVPDGAIFPHGERCALQFNCERSLMPDWKNEALELAMCALDW